MKTLAPRQLEHLEGKTGLSDEKRARYHLNLQKAGYEMPAATGGVLSLIQQFGKSLLRNARNGFKSPPSDVIQARRDTCHACPDFKDGRCMLCSCFVKAKTSWALERCPANPPKWTEWKADQSPVSPQGTGSPLPGPADACPEGAPETSAQPPKSPDPSTGESQGQLPQPSDPRSEVLQQESKA